MSTTVPNMKSVVFPSNCDLFLGIISTYGCFRSKFICIICPFVTLWCYLVWNERRTITVNLSVREDFPTAGSPIKTMFLMCKLRICDEQCTCGNLKENEAYFTLFFFSGVVTRNDEDESGVLFLAFGGEVELWEDSFPPQHPIVATTSLT